MWRCLFIFAGLLLSDGGLTELSSPAASEAVHATVNLANPFDKAATLNLYFDASATNPGSGTETDPFGRNNELALTIRENSSQGDTVALWVTGNGHQHPKFDEGYGQIGQLPAGRIYRIRGYGEQAVLSGAKHITGFRHQGNNIWRVSIPEEVIALYVDGEFANMATDSIMYSFDSYRKPIMESRDLFGKKPDGYYNGCKVESSYQVWNPFRAEVVSFTNASGTARISIDTMRVPDPIAPNPTLSFKLQFFGHPDFLQPEHHPAPFNWALDKAGGYLHIYSPVNPETLTIEGVMADYGIEIGASPTDEITVLVEGITFSKFKKDGLKIRGIYHDCVIRENSFNDCNRNGITLLGGADELLNANNLVEDNRFCNFGAGAIFAMRPFRSTFSGNEGYALETTSHTGFQDAPLPGNSAYGVSGLGDALHINNYTGTANSQLLVTRNSFARAQVHGMTISGRNNMVSYNEISNFGQLAADVGGIYCGGSWSRNNQFLRNTIHHSMGSARYADSPYSPAYGIYIDNNACEAYVRENRVFSCDAGTFINVGADNSEVTDNLFADNRYNIQVRHEYRGNINQADNLKITGNTMLLLGRDQRHFYLYAPFDAEESPYQKGIIDHNRYFCAVRGAAFSPMLDGLNSTRMNEGVSFANWQALTGYDEHSTEQYLATPEYATGKLIEIRNSFSRNQRILTSAGAGDFSDDMAGISLTGPAAVIGDGELFQATFDAENTRAGGVLEARLLHSGGYVEGFSAFFTTAEEARTFTFSWENNTGADVRLTDIVFRARGVDGSRYSQEIKRLVTGKTGTFTKTEPVLLSTGLDSEIFNGRWTLPDGTEVDETCVYKDLPQITTNNSPKPLLR